MLMLYLWCVLGDFHVFTYTFVQNLLLVLQSENPSGKRAKLHTVAASNNGVHPTRLLYYCLVAPLIYGCCLRMGI